VPGRRRCKRRQAASVAASAPAPASCRPDPRRWPSCNPAKTAPSGTAPR
jgi:hypothetical protein